MDPDTEENVNRVQREQAVESSVSKQHFFHNKANLFRFQLRVLPTASLPGSMCLLIHQGAGGGGAATFSDFRLQQLPASRYRTQGADPIKNEWDQAQLQVLCQVLMHPHRTFGCQHAPQLAQQRGD